MIAPLAESRTAGEASKLAGHRPSIILSCVLSTLGTPQYVVATKPGNDTRAQHPANMPLANVPTTDKQQMTYIIDTCQQYAMFQAMNDTKRKAGRPSGSFKGEFPTRIGGRCTRLYNKWRSMVARCTTPSHPAFKRYAGRGIAVAPEWCGFEGYQQFCRDMGEPPAGTTLERTNNALGYSAANCRWATWKEQAQNRRPKPPQDLNSLRQKAIRAGLPYSAVYQRIRIRGWTEEKALTTPIGKRGQHARQTAHT